MEMRKIEVKVDYMFTFILNAKLLAFFEVMPYNIVVTLQEVTCEYNNIWGGL